MQTEIVWNPWRGCAKCADGCLYCRAGVIVSQNSTQFNLPVRKKRIPKVSKQELPYTIPSGSIIRVCKTSDFFIEKADTLRRKAWDFIHERYDCLFHIVTKRPERILQSLPDLWLDGWDNVIISVNVETEDAAWEKIPILLNLPIKHKGISLEPMLERVDLLPFLGSGEIENVVVSGESYTGYLGMARELDITWVQDIQEQCKYFNTNFQFRGTGSQFKIPQYKNPVYVRERDEHNLAEFYKLDYVDESIGSWEANIKEIEKRHITEQAIKVYKQITLSDLGYNVGRIKGE